MRDLFVPYATWKTLAQAGGLPTYFVPMDGTDRKKVFTGSVEFLVESSVEGADHTDWVTEFQSAATQVVDIEEAIAKIVSVSIGSRLGEHRADDGKPLVSSWPTEGSRKTLISHNWCDPTTWYTNSVQVTNETPSEITPDLVYEVANDNLIDTYHGKLWAEDSDLTQYRVLVETSSDSGSTWDAKTEEDPHVADVTQGNDGDYVIDYSTGIITFHSALSGVTDVRVSYYYADLTDPEASHFIISPIAGKALKLRRAEVQFTTDVALKDTVVFETRGYVDVFAPQLLTTANPPGPYPPGTKIPVSTTVYKTMRDYYNEANGAQPTYPSLGGAGWRGTTDDVIVLQWDYAAVLPISSAAGMETHIYLQHNEPFGGTYATATVYGLSEDE